MTVYDVEGVGYWQSPEHVFSSYQVGELDRVLCSRSVWDWAPDVHQLLHLGIAARMETLMSCVLFVIIKVAVRSHHRTEWTKMDSA